MPVQDDAREHQLTDLFNLRVPENRRRDETDAFLHIDGQDLPFELKSTTKGSVGTVRDFGAKHVAKWKDLHWIFGFYNKAGDKLLYCQYASPADMAPWVKEKEQYVWPDAVLEMTASSLVTAETLAKIFDPPKDIYSLEDAKSIMKRQWRVSDYKAKQDLSNGYSPKRMMEMLQERCTYVIHRGGTLNNPKIPKSYFKNWEKITEDHAERLRKLVRVYLAAKASETDTPTA
jgi:hypothetical protein